MRKTNTVTSVVLFVALAVIAVYLKTSAAASGRSPAVRTTSTPATSRPSPVSATEDPRAPGSQVNLDEVPGDEQEAVQGVVAQIDRGGPFGYSKDGSFFRNAERRLPARDSRYYREFTVPTPGSRDRGARRLISGSAGELYYTNDHYRTFLKIR